MLVASDSVFRLRLCLLGAIAFWLAPVVASAQPTVGLIYRDSTVAPGYTLFAPLSYNVTYLIDNEGRLVHSWSGALKPGMSVYLLPSGRLLRTGCISGQPSTGGRIELVDWDGNVAWSYVCSDQHRLQHHDICALPNGNILMIAWEYKTRDEAIAEGRNPSTVQFRFLPDEILEVDPSASSVVWEWHVWDHLIQDYDATKHNFGVVRDHPELVDINWGGPWLDVDWTHTNCVVYNPALDQIMLSSRHFSEVWIIDHGTTSEQARGHTGGRYGRGGDLLYRWGNPQTYGRGNGASQRLFCQHDAGWIADSLPGAGHVLLFNNGVSRPAGSYSSVDEFVPPVDSLGFYPLRPDSTYGPDSAIWTVRLDTFFYSDHIGGSQRMMNGNTLICAGPRGTFLEETPDRQLAWEYINPVTSDGPQCQGETIPYAQNEVFKVRRYAPDYPGFFGRTMTPGGPIEMPAAIQTPTGRTWREAAHLVPLPSPFRQTTTLSFLLEHAGRVELAVSNSLGARVATLFNGVLSAGSHAVIWNAGNLAGGTYFCTLRCGSASETQRVILSR